jgi:TorA maturation chaperone TorD
VTNLSDFDNTFQAILKGPGHDLVLNSTPHAVHSSDIGKNDYVQLAQARSIIYRFLAWLYNRRPDTETIRILRESRAALVTLTGELGSSHPEAIDLAIQDINSMPVEKALQVLGVDRTYLFRGVDLKYGPNPGCESRYLGYSRMSEVANAYAMAGLNPVLDRSFFPDSLGIELSFMSALAEREARAAEQEQTAMARFFEEKQYRFLTEHLILWLDRLHEDVVSSARHSFWPAFVELTRMFVRTDTALLAEETAGERVEAA